MYSWKKKIPEDHFKKSRMSDQDGKLYFVAQSFFLTNTRCEGFFCLIQAEKKGTEMNACNSGHFKHFREQRY